MRYDVAILGAGPAGTWCACRLAAAGARVALVDGSHPREKPCGGGVTRRALAMIGQAGGQSEGVAIDSASFSYDGGAVEIPLQVEGPPRLEVFARSLFDARLLDRAAAAGAEVLRQRAVEISRDDDVWTVRTRGPDGSHAIRASWLVGADGANSIVRKRVSGPFDRSDLSIACGQYVHGVTSRRIDIVFIDTPAGYLWSFPRHDHLAVGVCAQADAASVATLMPFVDRWIEANTSGGRLERYSWPIPSLTAAAVEREQPSGGGWMLVGDAAGLVDPITREGIFFALQSGDAAASSLLAADAAARYAEQLRDTAYRELHLAARIKARFYRASFMRLLISALGRSERIRWIMADLVAGQQPYHTLRRRLLGTMEWRLMLELFGARRTFGKARRQRDAKLTKAI